MEIRKLSIEYLMEEIESVELPDPCNFNTVSRLTVASMLNYSLSGSLRQMYKPVSIATTKLKLLTNRMRSVHLGQQVLLMLLKLLY